MILKKLRMKHVYSYLKGRKIYPNWSFNNFLSQCCSYQQKSYNKPGPILHLD